MPPSAPGTQPLAGSTKVDLPGSSLTQWATHMQDVTSSMRMPPEVAVNCPQVDIVGVLNRLERMTMVRYCRLCFGVSQKCGCSSIPHQTPGQASALWTPPMISYMAMASSTETPPAPLRLGYLHRGTHHQDCLHLNLHLWTCFWLPLRKTCWPLLVSVGAAEDKDSQAHPLLLASAK